MPGKLDTTQGGTFISDWFKLRSEVAAADNPATPAATPELDLSRSAHGTDTEIWVSPVLAAGGGTVDIVLYVVNNGSLAAVETYRQAGTKASLNSKDQHKFTGLTAGKYYILLANLAGGAKWDVHVAVNHRI